LVHDPPWLVLVNEDDIERDIFISRYHRSDTRDRTGWRAEDDVVTQTLIPTVIEEGTRGERAFDIYSLLLRERIVFLGQEVDDQIANLIISQMLFLEAQDPEKDICLYINSPGGLAYAGMAIYDAIQHVRPEVSTICVGMAMSAAAMILCAGTPGKRLALPNARIMIHQGSAGARGAPSDMAIQLREVLAMTERMAEIIAHHSGRPTEQVQRDIERDYFMSAEEAVAYGLIDDIIPPRRGLSAPALEAVASAS
jgi:ATP-dependent Clp protease protease subunit